MRRSHSKKFRIILITTLLLLLTLPVLAQSGGDFDLPWSTVDGGGGTFSTGEDFSLGGTAGQADAGLMTGEDFSLAGGFWIGGVAASPPVFDIFLPLIVK